MHKRSIICLLVFLILAGCSTRKSLAPVSESKFQNSASFFNTHIVHKGETLYAIAFGYDTDFRQLASWNNLKPPYALRVGQSLRLHQSLTNKAYPQRTYPQVQNPVNS